MKANQLQYEECVKIYEKEGASGVYHFAKENLITDWSECYSCETETPDCDDGACLVCGCDKDSSPAFNNQNTNQIETTPFYWDCECCENYIHHCTEKICKSCNAEWEYQPDSRIDEIVLDDILYPHTPERNAFILKELSNHIGEDQMKTFVRKIVSEDK